MCQRENRSPQSALAAALREIQKPDSNCDGVLVIFRKRSVDGAPITCYRYSGPKGGAANLLLNGMAKVMDWRPGDSD